MAINITEVARRAGVSNATVSRVLAEKPYVSEDVRQRVLRAVQELNYHPSRVARSLRVRTSQIIGLIISDIQNPFFTSLVRAVEDQAYANKYAIFLCNSDEDVAKENLYIDLMLSERVAGVIITPTRETGGPARKLIEAKVPVVSVDRRILDLKVDTVVLDNVGAAYDLVSYLIAQGHRRIGAILGSQQMTTGHERHRGYKAALADHAIPLDPDLVRTGMPRETLGYQYANELLDVAVPPTAIFTGNNLLTIGALRAINERRLRIPEDIAIVGFDDVEWVSLIKPSLTVVAQPTYELGKMAATLVLDRIARPDLPIHEVVLKPELVIRESVRAVCPV